MDLSKAQVKDLYAAYSLYSNWSKMSGAQKSKALMSMGIQSYKFASGNDFSKEFLVKPESGSPGLTYGEAFNLFGSGVNVYSLSKNWNQLNTLQKITGGGTTALNLAQTGKNFGLLGYGTQGAAAPGAALTKLTAAGWTPTPAAGVGAITAKTGAAIPGGYTAVPSGIEGHVTAIPTANASTASGAVQGTPTASWGTPSYAGYVGAALEGVNAFNSLKSDLPPQQKAFQTEKALGLGAADIYTAGGASAAYAVLNSIPVTRKISQKAEKLLSKVDPISNLIGGLGGGGPSRTFDAEQVATYDRSPNGKFQVNDISHSIPIWNSLSTEKKKDLAQRLRDQGILKIAGTDEKPAGEMIPWKRYLSAPGSQTEDSNPGDAVREQLHSTVTREQLEQSPWLRGKKREQILSAWDETHGVGEDMNLNGVAGGSQMQAGLANLLKTNPYVGGALIAHSAFEHSAKEADGNTGLMYLKKGGLKHDGATLADGTPINFEKESDAINTKADLPYYAGLTGITLSEMLGAGKDPALTKAGQKIGNGVLKNVGENAPFNPETFSKVRDNFRAVFSQSGIGSISDAYKHANVLYAAKRINDTDLVRMHQVADMTFGDNGFQIASKLFPGRTRGLEVANEVPVNTKSPSSLSHEDIIAKNQARYGGSVANVSL